MPLPEHCTSTTVFDYLDPHTIRTHARHYDIILINKEGAFHGSMSYETAGSYYRYMVTNYESCVRHSGIGVYARCRLVCWGTGVECVDGRYERDCVKACLYYSIQQREIYRYI